MRISLAAVIGLLATPVMAAGALAWPAPKAAWRVRIERAKDSPWPAPVSQVYLAPGNVDPEKCKATVCASDGTPVNAQMAWAAAGELLSVMFDTAGSGGSSRYLYLEPTAASDRAWQPQAGTWLETRRIPFARPNTWDEAWRVWTNAKLILGRTPQSLVFNGIHPHGGTSNFVALFTAWFTVPKTGGYGFAVVASGPAFLRIDDKVVAQRGVQATAGRGTRGQYGGTLKLTSGRHKLEYLAVHSLGEWIAEVAWKPPESPHFVLMPPRAFEQVGHYEVQEYETAPGTPARPYFTWEITGHNLIDETALVNVRFHAFPDVGSQWVWNFPDGTAAGNSPSQVFLRTGFQRVELAARQGGAALAQVINVHPLWTQMAEWDARLFAAQKKELLARDFSKTSPDSLAALVEAADGLGDLELLAHAGVFCLRRQAEFGPVDARAFYLLGFHYENPEVRQYADAENAWRAAVKLGLPATQDKARLRLAQYLVDIAGQPDEALKLTAQVNPRRLMEADARLKQLVRGDAVLLQGNVAEARAAYEKAGNLVSEINRTQIMRSRAQLEAARDLVRRSEFSRAADILKQIEWETPLDRLSVETAYIWLQIYLSRKEYPRALTRSQQALQVAVVDTQRADLLYFMAESLRGLSRVEESNQALQKLVDEFPYSEAAAKAKDKYGIAPKPKGRK